MDDIRVGSVVRRLRIRARLRQVDLAKRAGVSHATISRIEHGHLDTVSLRTLRRVLAALDVRLDLQPRWRGGDLDRMLNARHARLHELVARHLGSLAGWSFQPEVSFAIYADRGVIDILCYHAIRNALLVIELKTEVVDVNELLGAVDRKVRVCRDVARSRGWPIRDGVTVSAWIIVADGRTNRRRVDEHRTMLRAAFPRDGRSVGPWLRDPGTAMRALSFWPDAHAGNGRPVLAGVRRVSKPSERGT